jgi:hypothetical protein
MLEGQEARGEKLRQKDLTNSCGIMRMGWDVLDHVLRNKRRAQSYIVHRAASISPAQITGAA